MYMLNMNMLMIYIFINQINGKQDYKSYAQLRGVWDKGVSVNSTRRRTGRGGRKWINLYNKSLYGIN